VAAVFRHLHPAMAQMEVPQVPLWGEANRPRVTEFLALLDGHLAGRPFLCGEDFTVADITGLVALDFMKPARLQAPPELARVRAWHERLAQRPSAQA
jgi:glutathione S-transferase